MTDPADTEPNPDADRQRPTVAVFAPAPQLTVTVECLAHGGDEIHVHAGGQGVWIARMAATLGAHVRLCGAFGGESGTILTHLVRNEGVDVVITEVAGANPIHLQDRRGGERQVIASQEPATMGRHEVDDLYGHVLATAMEADILAVGGPVDRDEVPLHVYQRLATDLATLGTPVVADLSGDILHAALEGRLTVLKVSHEDLMRDGDAASADTDHLVGVMRDLQRAGAESVIVTRGGETTLVLSDDGVHEILTPQLEEADHRGAGDSLTAGVAVGLARGDGLLEAVRLGAAAGTSSVARHGLASAQAELIDRMIPRIEVRAVSGTGS